MNGYADNLIAKARGHAEVIQPFVPSLFERTGPPVGLWEAVETVEAAPLAPALERAPVEDTAPVSREPRAAEPDVEVRTVERERILVDPAPVVERWRERVAAPDPKPPRAVAEPREESKRARAVEQTSLEIRREMVSKPVPVPVETRLVVEREPAMQTTQPTRNVESVAPPMVEARVVDVAQPDAPMRPPRRERAWPVSAVTPPAAQAPPEVHVTIGRVEIRATGPATPGARPKGRQAMSLDEYLKQRVKGDLR